MNKTACCCSRHKRSQRSAGVPDSEKRCQYATILGIKLASGCRAPGCGVPPLRLSSAAHVGLARWGVGAGERCHPPTPHLKSPGSPDGAGGGIEPASRRWRKVCGSEVRRKPWVVGTPKPSGRLMGMGWITAVANNLWRPLCGGCRGLGANRVTLPPSPPLNWGLACRFGRAGPRGKTPPPERV